MDDFIKKIKSESLAGITITSLFQTHRFLISMKVILFTALLLTGSSSLARTNTFSESAKTQELTLKNANLSLTGDRTFEELEFSLLSSTAIVDSDNELIRKFQLNSSDPKWPYLLSILYLKLKTQGQGDNNYLLDSAARMARQSFEMSRGDSYGYLALANLLSFGKQHEKALTILEKIKGAFPKESWRADLFEIKFLFAAGRSKEAVARIHLIMSHENRSVRLAAMNLCATLCDENLGSIAEKDVLVWPKSSPSPDTTIVSARYFSTKGQTDKVRKTLKEGLKNFRGDIQLARELAFELTSNSPTNPDYAIKLLESGHTPPATAATPSSELLMRSSDFKTLGYAWLLKKNVLLAESHFLKALALNPTPELVLNIIDDYRSEKFTSAGLLFLEKAIEICPGNSSLHALKGALYSEELKGFSMSENSYFDAISLNPRESSHFNSLGLLYYKFNNLDKAMTSFAVATALNPRDANAFYNLACVEALKGKNEKALAALKKAIELAPNLQALASTDRDLNSLHVMPGFSELTSGAPSH